MTCIVAVRDRRTGRVVVGGDCAGISSHMDSTLRKDPKVFRNGDFVIGFTSSYRMGQALMFKLDAPKPPPRASDLFQFMVAEFAEAVRETLKSAGYTRVDSNREDAGTFIVATGSRLFAIHDDLQVCEPRADFYAVGCGEDYAKGALAVLPQSMPARKRCTAALRAAERFSAGVRGPFVYEVT